MQIIIRAAQSELDGILTAVKTDIPALKAIKSVTVKSFGIQADVDTPVGNVRAEVELQITQS